MLGGAHRLEELHVATGEITEEMGLWVGEVMGLNVCRAEVVDELGPMMCWTSWSIVGVADVQGRLPVVRVRWGELGDRDEDWGWRTGFSEPAAKRRRT